MRCFSVFFLLFILISGALRAQNRNLKNRFNAGMVVGINTSQIDGDNYAGFDKYGFFAGARGIAKLTEKSELVVEMLYNRKGSKNPDRFIPLRIPNTFISLDYIQVPILFHRKIAVEKGVGSFETGLAYAQLFGVRINEFVNNRNHPSFAAVQDHFNKNDLSFIVGVGFFFNEHIRISGRADYSMSFLYKNVSPIDLSSDHPLKIRHLRNMQLGVGLNYIF